MKQLLILIFAFNSLLAAPSIQIIPGGGSPSSNWNSSGSTNSFLPGVGYTFGIFLTNYLEVGPQMLSTAYTLKNAGWAPYSVPYFRPSATGKLAFDLMPNGSGGGIDEIHMDICSTDIVADSVNFETLELKKLVGGSAWVGGKSSGSGITRDLVLNGYGANVGVGQEPLIRFQVHVAAGINFGVYNDSNSRVVLDSFNDTYSGVTHLPIDFRADGFHWFDSNGSIETLTLSNGGDLTISAKINLPKTVTTIGTTGAQTINKISGRVNFAALATSLVVTDSTVTVNSIILITKAANDSTARLGAAVAASGSFTIFMDVAPAAECAVNFLVIN